MFIKFTASGCSKDDSLEGCQCPRLRHHRSRLHRVPRRLLSHCRQIRRFHRSEGNVTIGGPVRSRVMLSPSACSGKLSKTSLIVAFCYGQLRNPTFFAALSTTFLDAALLFCRRKQELQRRFDPCRPSRFAVTGALSFHVLKILVGFPAFLNHTIE